MEIWHSVGVAETVLVEPFHKWWVCGDENQIRHSMQEYV